MTTHRRFAPAALLMICVAPGLAVAGDAPTLESTLLPMIRAHKGRVGLAVKNLKSGESYAYHADDPMPTASLIKFPVMIEAYRQAGAKLIQLDEPVTLRAADKVPGSGILTDHFSDGARFPLRDAVRLMIVFSDNTATNLVLDRIGLKSTAETMEAMGCPNTKVHSKVFRRDTSVFPERSKQFGLGSTTPAEMLRLLEALHAGTLVDPAASKAMMEAMRACDDKLKFARHLPPEAKLAQKTGSVDASRTAAGLFETPAGPVALCVMTTDNDDHSWSDDNAGDLLCASVARAVYAAFKAEAAAKP